MMSKVRLLVVEDDDNKLQELSAFIEAKYPKVEIEIVRSLISALRSVRKEPPTLVLLDMTLPNYDVQEGDGGLHAFGGEEFLRQIRRFKIQTQVIVVTQFESFGEPPDNKGLSELDRELKDEFPEYYRGSVYYHASIDWTNELVRLMEEFAPEIAQCC